MHISISFMNDMSFAISSSLPGIFASCTQFFQKVVGTLVKPKSMTENS